MTESPPVAPPAGRPLRSCLLVLGGALACLLATGVGAWIWYGKQEQAAEAARKTEAEAEFAPIYKQLDDATANPGPIDVDKTVRVIHELDEAMKTSPNLEDYLHQMAQEDYRGVAPEVLAARKDLLGVIFELQSRQVELADQEAAWNYTTDVVLGTLSLVNVGGNVDTTGGVPTGGEGHLSVDRQQAEDLLKKIQDERDMHAHLQRDVHDLQARLLDATMKWSGTWYGYVDQWDRLCLLRDRAYLAAADGNWEEAAASARQVIALAPEEREAHLLLALARIEGAKPGEEGDVDVFLARFVNEHPDSAAPALQLQGVSLSRQGRPDEARLVFQQAAASYPAQSETLARLADPYRYRTDLRKTREGTYILRLYQETQLGAGYFSPDLQMARAAFERGDKVEGQKKVLDHFFRRRNQAQWGLILDDLDFCSRFLGADFDRMFPEDSFLDLNVAPTLMGGKLKMSINNRSDRTVHNATLLLALHLTDQHPDDYEVVRVDPTVAAVNAHAETDFADTEIKITIFGQEKGISDIVTDRAILVADEGVMWVDTEEFKIAEAEAFRQKRALPGTEPTHAAGMAAGAVVEQALAAVKANAHMTVKQAMIGPDDVVIELPRAIILLAPTFRLEIGDDPPIGPDESVIDGQNVVLTWKRVHSWDAAGGSSPRARLHVGGPFSAFYVDWQGDSSASYVLASPPTLE